MADALSFPKTRHLALSIVEQGTGDEAGLAEAAEVLASLLPGAAPGSPYPFPVAPAAAPGQPGAALLARAWMVDVSVPADAEETCRAIDGGPAGGAEAPLRCPCSLLGRERSATLARRAAAAGDAVLLAGLDRWYEQGPERAGFCRSCELALVELLRDDFGDHLEPFDALAALRARANPADVPFALQREAARLAFATEAGKRAILAARDAARRERGAELAVLGRCGTLGAVGLRLCRHLDGIVFDLPSADPLKALLPLLAARSALGQRPVIAVPPRGVGAQAVALLAALASACDADLALPSGASPEAQAALAAHRRFFALVRERFRPVEPLLDVEVAVSPHAAHWTAGAHLEQATAATASLARAHLLVGALVDLGDVQPARRSLLVLAGCSALHPREAAGARRHVMSGGDALVIGPCLARDEDGKVGEPVFPEVRSAGLIRVGEGRVVSIAVEGERADAAALDQQTLRGARDMLGRGRAHLSLSGRAQLLVRAYLDPERKLDLHLVNLELRDEAIVPAQGVLLHIAGQAAGAGRTGYWFAPDRAGGRDGERIALHPSGFSVSTVLPGIGSSALLAVPR